MKVIESKEIKEAIDNVKKEQNEKGLNDLERLKDWEERYIFRSEQLEEAGKELKKKISEVQSEKQVFDKLKEFNKQSYEGLLAKKDAKIRLLEENKKYYEEEIRKLKRSKEVIDEIYNNLNEENLEDKKELEKKEWKIKALERILEEENRSKQISSLNKLYKDEIEKLEFEIKDYSKEIEEYKEKGLSELTVFKKQKVERLKEELEKVKLKEEQNNQQIAQQESNTNK